MNQARLLQIQETLCNGFCAEIRLTKKTENLVRIDTPFFFNDGDPYQLFLEELASGGLRISDQGHTLMHISYEHDIDKFRQGTRNKLFSQIISELQLGENNGEFFIECEPQEITKAIFQFGQGLTKIYDLTFLSRVRVESTFYDDLLQELISIIPQSLITADYLVPNIPNSDRYMIDYAITTQRDPFYILVFQVKKKLSLSQLYFII
jgi:Domain of unknown function DUF1828